MTKYTTGYRPGGYRPADGRSAGAHLPDDRPGDRPDEVRPVGDQRPEDELMRVREDIELRCRELGATIEELAARVDIRSRARRMAEDMWSATSRKRMVAVSVAGGLLLATAVMAVSRTRRQPPRN